MLFFIIAISSLSIFATFFFTIFSHAFRNGKEGISNKPFFAVLLSSFLLLGGSVIAILALEPKFTDAEVIQFDAVYLKDFKNNEYIVKVGDDLYNIANVKVYKGDDNYIIHYAKPNLTKKLMFITGAIDKDKYVIITTDTNINELETIN